MVSSVLRVNSVQHKHKCGSVFFSTAERKRRMKNKERGILWLEGCSKQASKRARHRASYNTRWKKKKKNTLFFYTFTQVVLASMLLYAIVGPIAVVRSLWMKVARKR